MKRNRKRGRLLTAVLMTAALLTACGGSGVTVLDAGNHYYYPSETEAETETAAEIVDEEESYDFYLVVSNDTVNEELHLYNYNTQMEYQYRYGMDTQFYNKYGGYDSSANFTPGKAVWIGTVAENGRLTEIGISDQVWEYEDITRFSTDPDGGILTIAENKYSYGSDAYTFSDGREVAFSTITSDDELSVVGIGKKILSVSVTTGHGTLALTNTSLFEGSFLQLNTSIFTIITENMTMDLPEGTYELTVANDGWGGSTEIEIARGETTTVDLDTLKGDGPSYGSVLFAIDVEGAALLIDDETVDYSQPIQLKYGKHSLAVITEDYDEWDRTLYVNSPEATIVISLSDGSSDSSETETETETESETESSESSQSSESSEATESSESDSDSTQALEDYLKDYLSTLSTLIG